MACVNDPRPSGATPTSGKVITTAVDLNVAKRDTEVFDIKTGSVVKIDLVGDGPFDVYLFDQANYKGFMAGGDPKTIIPIALCQAVTKCSKEAAMGASQDSTLKIVLGNPHEADVIVQGELLR